MKWCQTNRHFAAPLSTGLAGDADSNGDGRIWGRELATYIQHQVSMAATLNSHPQTPQWQLLPGANGGAAGDILLSAYHRDQTPGAPPPLPYQNLSNKYSGSHQPNKAAEATTPEALLAHYREKLAQKQALDAAAQQRVIADRRV